MPKQVDHDQRRAHIVEATWRLIAGSGYEAANMREIAREAGFANGALTRYFPSKSALMRASFEHIVARTNERITRQINQSPGKPATGLAALRIFALEVMPVSPEKVLEAAVVIGYWQRALQDDTMRGIYEENLTDWRNRIAHYLAQAGDLGEIPAGLDHDVEIDHMLTLLTGTQITGSLVPLRADPESLHRLLEGHLTRLQTPISEVNR